VEGSGIETKRNAQAVEKAIEDADNGVVRDTAERDTAEPDTAEPDTASTAEPSINHEVISQRSSSRQLPGLEKVNPAAALEAIVAAQASLKSLPKMGAQATIIAGPQCQDGTCQESTRSLDTVLNWADTPADAYRQAVEAEKLVFLIHVSGNFEIPGFT
jgi:hypothetical protein